MTLDPTRSTCIVALPRTGSTVLVDYLCRALTQQNAAELFQFSRIKIRRINHVADTGIFDHDYQMPIDKNPELKNISIQDYRRQFVAEYHKRLDILRNFTSRHSPVVFKIFADKFMLSHEVDLKQIAQQFNVVVLYRQNVMKSLLSESICDRLYKFHEHDTENLHILKNRVTQLKIVVDENNFRHRLRQHIFLHEIAQTGSAAGHCVLKFEDFEYNAFEQLNNLLGFSVPGRPWANKFITDHEQCISNLEQLQDIYGCHISSLSK